jgi:hypothetical protein
MLKWTYAVARPEQPHRLCWSSSSRGVYVIDAMTPTRNSWRVWLEPPAKPPHYLGDAGSESAALMLAERDRDWGLTPG